MNSDILDLLKRLIVSAPTLDNGELNAATTLHNFFLANKIPSKLDIWDNKRANVVAQIGLDDEKAPTLVAGGHIDVVPAGPECWDSDPFKPVEKDGFLYGRGSVDMLGGLCAFAAAMADLHASGKALNGRIMLAATAGEETDSCGVKRFLQTHMESIRKPIGILIPEPTGLKILRAHRGILWLKVTTFGKTAHGSMPHLGINAIEKANLLLNRLRTWHIPHIPHELLGGCSVSINRIYGGSATNIVPDFCSIEVDIRTLPDQSPQNIIAEVEKLIAEIAHNDSEFRAEVSVLRACPALETHADDFFVKAVCKATRIHETHAIGFTTDGPLFARLGAPVLIFGPGDGSKCHQPNEAIEISQLQKAREDYEKIMLEAVGC